MDNLSCWVVSEGKAGMENQCVGLAQALGLKPVVKRVRLRTPWRQLSPFLRLGLRWCASPEGDPLAPPWPDLAIGTGRGATAPLLAAKRLSGGRTITVMIQDPQIDPRHFDLVVVPRHDRLRGGNVVTSRGALHHVTPAKLRAAADRFGPALAHLPHPRVAVLVGGNSGVHRLTPAITARVADQLAHLAREHGAGLMVTPSRRTGAENEAVLRERLAGLPAVVWDGGGENPYFGYLALADHIVVTNDSVSMASEAASTGKPVYVIDLEGGSPKFDRFHQALRAEGVTRPFEGTLGTWSYEPLDDTERIAELVRERLLSPRPGRSQNDSTATGRS